MSPENKIKTYAEIESLWCGGRPLDEILVNDDDASWGETGATTRQAALDLVREWGYGDIKDLMDAATWMERNPIEDPD